MADLSNMESMQMTAEYQNTFKIMVATDCHLGYQENDPIIGDDSFVTFEEILKMSVEKAVDMILLGGDLFHHNNPSQQCLNRCMSLLRQYTMGNRPVAMELLSDAPIVQHEGAAPVNYLDNNINVSIPVFTIHGNHDDPSGLNHCSAMDTLSSAGLVNYFGKWTDLSQVVIQPILLQKGTSYLALYGLSHIKDERLCRLYIEDKVKMARPKESPEKWFNIFVLHQNRVDRGPKRYIPEAYLHSFLDLVVWGHEHDCDILPTEVADKGVFITQPGSSVPTSLSEGETKPKHVGLLEVRGRQFKITPLKLKTTRPFIWETIHLGDVPVTSDFRRVKCEEITNFCLDKVEKMIVEAKNLLTGHPKQPKIPFIRLRCEFDDESQLFNLVKFGQNFYKRVANPDCEVVKVKKLPQRRDRKDLKQAKDDVVHMEQIKDETPELFADCVESIVDEYFENYADKKLIILSVKGMAQATERCIEKNESNAIANISRYQRERTLEKLLQTDIQDDNVLAELLRLRDERQRRTDEQDEEFNKAFDRDRGVESNGDFADADAVIPGSDEDDADMFPAPPPPTASRRGRGQSKKAAAPRRSNDEDDDDGEWTASRAASASRGRGKAKAAAVVFDDEDDDDWDAPAPPPTRGKARTSRASANTSSMAVDDDDWPDAAPKARGRGRGSRGPRATSASTRGRASKAKTAAAPSVKPFFAPLTPNRTTPVRMAASASQASMRACQYQDEEFSD